MEFRHIQSKGYACRSMICTALNALLICVMLSINGFSVPMEPARGTDLNGWQIRFTPPDNASAIKNGELIYGNDEHGLGHNGAFSMWSFPKGPDNDDFTVVLNSKTNVVLAAFHDPTKHAMPMLCGASEDQSMVAICLYSKGGLVIVFDSNGKELMKPQKFVGNTYWLDNTLVFTRTVRPFDPTKDKPKSGCSGETYMTREGRFSRSGLVINDTETPACEISRDLVHPG